MIVLRQPVTFKRTNITLCLTLSSFATFFTFETVCFASFETDPTQWFPVTWCPVSTNKPVSSLDEQYTQGLCREPQGASSAQQLENLKQEQREYWFRHSLNWMLRRRHTNETNKQTRNGNAGEIRIVFKLHSPANGHKWTSYAQQLEELETRSKQLIVIVL